MRLAAQRADFRSHHVVDLNSGHVVVATFDLRVDQISMDVSLIRMPQRTV